MSLMSAIAKIHSMKISTIIFYSSRANIYEIMKRMIGVIFFIMDIRELFHQPITSFLFRQGGLVLGETYMYLLNEISQCLVQDKQMGNSEVTRLETKQITGAALYEEKENWVHRCKIILC